MALAALAQTAAPVAQVATPQQAQVRLADPTGDPLAAERMSDPILALARGNVNEAEFMALVATAVDRYPGVDEVASEIDEAEAAEDEARAGLYPTVDINLSSNRTLARTFEGSALDNLIERSRPEGRTDAAISVEQTLFDFGATSARIAAAGARLRAASLRAEDSADRTALRAIAAWYDVFTYRALVTLGTAFAENQLELRSAVQSRIEAGVSAPGDLPRVESYIASSQADLARYRRQLAGAEARFEEIFGVPAPQDLGRAPVVRAPGISKELAQVLARSTAQAESADAQARAARQDAKAQRADTLPRISAAVDAGKYGIRESDYDVRGTLLLRHRIFGGVEARADQATARANSADARASRIRAEAEREAVIAWSDVRALEQQLAALEESYVASRQSRDVLAERFRVARGTLFDLLESESAYFNVAASYIRAITELDAARYVLLSRTGRLLDTLNIEPPSLDNARLDQR